MYKMFSTIPCTQEVSKGNSHYYSDVLALMLSFNLQPSIKGDSYFVREETEGGSVL